MKNRYQRGEIFRKGDSWFGRWWEDTLIGGQPARQRRCRKLAEFGDRCRSRKDVQPLLDAILKDLNAGKSGPETTLSVSEFAERFFFPDAEANLKPSTAHGYRADWRMYLGDRLRRVSLRDFRCCDATAVLAAVYQDRGVSRKTLRHCKALLSRIFTFAKQRGALDGINPVQDAAIPRQARGAVPTHAVTPDEVSAMLDVLDGQARLAVALMFFAALRPGEARGVRWEDFDGKRLHVRRSVWRTFETAPKTESSIAQVPVCSTLAEILEQNRNGGGYILHTPSGKPLDLHNLANRVVIPTLKAAGLRWYGWRALRTGAATLLVSVESPLAAKGLLRHSNVATTTRSYVKDVPSDTVRGMEKVDALFERTARERMQ